MNAQYQMRSIELKQKILKSINYMSFQGIKNVAN